MSATNLQVQRLTSSGWVRTGRGTTLYAPTLTYQSVGAEATGIARTPQTFASHSASWAGVSGSSSAPTFAAASNTTYSNMDIFGRVSASGPGVVFNNCRFRGYQISPWVSESTIGLLHLTNSGISGLIANDCTFIPDYPGIDWDGVIGHDFTLNRCLIANVNDGIGVQNSANTTGDSGILIDTCYISWLTFYTPEPAGTTPNNDAKTHNDCMQIVHPLQGITIRNSNMTCHFSMPDGMGVLNDPFGYAGVGGDDPSTIPNASDGTAPNAPYYPSPCGNAVVQVNTNAAAASITIDGCYFDGGAASINLPTPRSEVQVLTVNATGGSIKLSGGYGATGTTAAINVSGMTASTVQAAVRTLPGFSGVTVSGSGPYQITFPMTLGDVAQLTVNNTSATGGTAVVTTTTNGVPPLTAFNLTNNLFGHNQRSAGTGSGFGTDYLGRVRPSSDPLYNDTATVISTAPATAAGIHYNMVNNTYWDNGQPIHVR